MQRKKFKNNEIIRFRKTQLINSHISVPINTSFNFYFSNALTVISNFIAEAFPAKEK